MLAEAVASTGRDVLDGAGFRAPDGSGIGDKVAQLKITDPKGVDKALRQWQVLATPMRSLVVLDGSGSMQATIGDSTRANVLIDAALEGSAPVPQQRRTRRGCSRYRQGRAGVDWDELAPIKRLDTPGHREKLVATATDALTNRLGGGTASDTALAAYIRCRIPTIQATPTASSLMTDGRNGTNSISPRTAAGPTHQAPGPGPAGAAGHDRYLRGTPIRPRSSRSRTPPARPPTSSAVPPTSGRVLQGDRSTYCGGGPLTAGYLTESKVMPDAGFSDDEFGFAGDGGRQRRRNTAGGAGGGTGDRRRRGVILWRGNADGCDDRTSVRVAADPTVVATVRSLTAIAADTGCFDYDVDEVAGADVPGRLTSGDDKSPGAVGGRLADPGAPGHHPGAQVADRHRVAGVVADGGGGYRSGIAQDVDRRDEAARPADGQSDGTSTGDAPIIAALAEVKAGRAKQDELTQACRFTAIQQNNARPASDSQRGRAPEPGQCRGIPVITTEQQFSQFQRRHPESKLEVGDTALPTAR